MKILRIILIGLALSIVAGCSTQEREYAAFAKLKNGMSEAELTSTLGKPEKTEATADFIVWTYPAGMVFFREGKVYSWTIEPSRP